jgi:hypothetical protein
MNILFIDLNTNSCLRCAVELVMNEGFELVDVCVLSKACIKGILKSHYTYLPWILISSHLPHFLEFHVLGRCKTSEAKPKAATTMLRIVSYSFYVGSFNIVIIYTYTQKSVHDS